MRILLSLIILLLANTLDAAEYLKDGKGEIYCLYPATGNTVEVWSRGEKKFVAARARGKAESIDAYVATSEKSWDSSNLSESSPK